MIFAVPTTGKENIDLATDGMVNIAATVNESAKMIEKLGKNSAQIGEIVTVINSIAEQTNLLALNAAIEAARAGEQGGVSLLLQMKYVSWLSE